MIRLPLTLPLSVITLLAVLAALLAPPLAQAEGDEAAGAALMEAVDRSMRAGGEIMSVEVLRTAGGNEEVQRFKVWSLAPEGGTEVHSLVRFSEPADVAGLALLTARRGQSTDQHLFLPFLGQARRLAASDRREPFAGTDFTLEDISAGYDPERRTYRLVRSEDIDGETCQVVEDTPATPREARQSGYSKVELCVFPETSLVRRIDFFDRNGSLFKRMDNSDPVEISEGRWRWRVAFMQDLTTGNSTRMTVQDRTYPADVSPTLFTVANLERR